MSKYVLFLGLVLLVSLAACGIPTAQPAPNASPTTAAAANPTAVASDNSAAAAAPEATGEANPSDMRTITDARGRQVEVPVDPQHVITLSEHDLDSALAVGITPVGSVNGRGQQTLPSYLGDRVNGITSVGSLAEPSLETVVKLNPDLILAGNLIEQIEGLLPQLEEIAPVVVTYQTGDDWKTAFAGTAEALNRTDEADAFLADYDERVTAIKAHMPTDKPVMASIVRWMPDGPVVMNPGTFASTILADLGMERPAHQQNLGGSHGAHSDPISLEALDQIDGDWLFIGTLNPEGTTALDEARKNPLFQQLSAVQNDRVVVVDGTVWTSVGGPLAALKVLDDVEAAMHASTAAAFPVTIEHKYGSTTIPEAPERVVSLGYNEQDAILALGITPVAVRYWFGEEPNAVFPWAQDELGDAAPEVLNMPFGELNFEQIAALQPDLISGVYSGISEEEYETLSRIAPTIAQSGEYVDFGMPWQEMTLTVGRALGREERAEELVTEVEELFAAARERHPEWAGKSVVIANGPGAGAGDQYGFVASEDGRARVFTALGFEVPDELDEIAGDQFYGTISLERADLLDRDLLVFHQMQWVEGGRAALEGEPLLQQLDAMQEGRVVFIGGELDDALQFGTVLSLPFLLERLVPMIEAAMDGDPATPVEGDTTDGSPSPAAEPSPEATQTTRSARTVTHALGEMELLVGKVTNALLEHGERQCDA